MRASTLSSCLSSILVVMKHPVKCLRIWVGYWHLFVVLVVLVCCGLVCVLGGGLFSWLIWCFVCCFWLCGVISRSIDAQYLKQKLNVPVLKIIHI